MPKPRPHKTREAAAPGVPPRVLAAIAIVVLLALLGALNYYQFLVAYQPVADREQVAAQQERFRGVADAIPAGTVLTYLSDVPHDGGGFTLQCAAQYALAPRMIDPAPSARHDWTLGNFFQSYDAARIAQERGLSVVRDFGNGVVLFRRGAR